MLRWNRMAAMAIKELQVMLLDKRARVVLLIAPLLQLVVFGLAVTLEVKNIDIGIVNRDAGRASEQLLAAVQGSRNFREVIVYADTRALQRGIEQREVIAGLEIPPDLSNRVASGQTGTVGLVLDGRRVNSAQIVAGYLGEMVGQVGLDLRPSSRLAAPQVLETRWFNPNLNYRWFTMPSLVALISALLVLAVSLQSVARERELGTYDELLILPLRPSEILVGKVVPAFIAGFVNAAIYVALIPLIYGVPLHGSLFLIFLASFAFSLAMTGIGLSISAIAQTQQQAFLYGYVVMVPLIMTSGFTSPVDNMPQWLQIFARLNPVYYNLLVCQGVFLKDVGFSFVFNQIWPMLAVSIVTLSLSVWLFRRRVS